MTSLYRHILKQAWEVLVKYKYLWPLGLFAAFLGNGGEYQVLFKQIQSVYEQPEKLQSFRSLIDWQLINNVANWSNSNGFFMGFFLVLVAIVAAIIIYLAIVSILALIKGVAEKENSKSPESSFKKLFNQHRSLFWPGLGLFVVARVITYLIISILLTPLMIAAFAANNIILNTFTVAFSLVIFVPLAMIVSFVTKYAMAYLVIGRQKMWDAFRSGWQLFANNWLISLELAFILLVINLIVGLVLLLLLLVCFAPFYLLASFNAGVFLPIVALGVFVVIILIVGVGAGLAVFQNAAWTLLFIKVSGQTKYYSKFVRLIAGAYQKIKSTK